MKKVKKEQIIATHINNDGDWAKMDLILFLDTLDTKYLKSNQQQAGVILFYVTDKTRELVNTWYETACNYHMIDDSPSLEKNLPTFMEHRHDQSIFSLLTKKMDLYSRETLNSAVEYNRNRTGSSRIE
jgi:hypothetical protein